MNRCKLGIVKRYIVEGEYILGFVVKTQCFMCSYALVDAVSYNVIDEFIDMKSIEEMEANVVHDVIGDIMTIKHHVSVIKPTFHNHENKEVDFVLKARKSNGERIEMTFIPNLLEGEIEALEHLFKSLHLESEWI